MANFIGLVFGTLKKEGIDTKNMSVDDAIAKYNEITKSSSKSLTSGETGVKIQLPKQEYAQVAHALATKYANKSVKATSISIGNTMYMVKKVRPGYFEVVDKIDIEEFRNLVEMLEDKDD